MTNQMQSLDTVLLRCYDHDLGWSLQPTRIRKLSSYINCFYGTYQRLYPRNMTFIISKIISSQQP